MESILLSNGLKMPMEGFGVCNFYPHVLADFCETVVVIPKSTHKERMEQNMDVWDFALSDADMAEIAKLDMGHSEIVDHYDPKFVKALHTRKLHA